MRQMRAKTESAPKVLIVLHQEHSNAGRVGRMLQAQGAILDIRRPPLGDALPATMDDHAGAVIFGGPMGANDDHDWLKREIDWIGTALDAEKPFLGICLGAQMLSKHLGHRVYTHPDGHAEIGYYPIRPTAEADTLCACAFPKTVYQWHRDGFDLPRGAKLLAEGTTFETQAFAWNDHAVGLQFHPEVTYAMMCRWTTRAHERMGAPNARERQHHLDGWFQHDAAVARWLDCFLRTWLAKQPEKACAKTKMPELELA